MRLGFSFDFISPYAYLGWHLGRRVAERRGVAFEPRPVLFAALLNAYGHKGPAEIPPKRRYVAKNVLRLAHDARVRILPPPSHPFRPLLALRLASLPLPPERRSQLIDRLFAAAWGGGPGLESPPEVARVLVEAGFDGPALVAQAGSPEAKDSLRRSTDAALAEGVFGVPTFHVGQELFWGVDALPHAERALLGQDPVDPEWVARWENLPSTASR
jgi:2-hydroxychromene-2-carboxylate isomerase